MKVKQDHVCAQALETTARHLAIRKHHGHTHVVLDCPQSQAFLPAAPSGSRTVNPNVPPWLKPGLLLSTSGLCPPRPPHNALLPYFLRSNAIRPSRLSLNATSSKALVPSSRRKAKSPSSALPWLLSDSLRVAWRCLPGARLRAGFLEHRTCVECVHRGADTTLLCRSDLEGPQEAISVIRAGRQKMSPAKLQGAAL